MENDDRQVGKLWTRRDFLGLVGISSGIIVTGGIASPNLFAQQKSLPPCVAVPEQTEGPYFVDEKLNRSDIRTDTKSGKPSEGTPLNIEFRVSQIGKKGCSPLGEAMVDIWHCDALGVYSGVEDWQFDTTEQNFLRGHQITDKQGIAKFLTVFPGWYRGRTVHIHFKIRTEQNKSNYDFTSQLYFDDKLTDQIFLQSPYNKRGQRNIRNERDGIYRDGGNKTMLNLVKSANGYQSIFEIGVQIG